MKIQIFTIPIVGGEEDNFFMNNFLSSHRVIDVQQQIVADKHWTFCVRYVDKVSADANANNGKKEKIDYRKILDKTPLPSSLLSEHGAKKLLQKKPCLHSLSLQMQNWRRSANSTIRASAQ